MTARAERNVIDSNSVRLMDIDAHQIIGGLKDGN